MILKVRVEEFQTRIDAGVLRQELFKQLRKVPSNSWLSDMEIVDEGEGSFIRLTFKRDTVLEQIDGESK